MVGYHMMAMHDTSWVFWVVLILFLTSGARSRGHRHHHAPSRPPAPRPVPPPSDESPTVRALTELNERYARGEIDHAEYEERRSALTGQARDEKVGDTREWPDLG